jgi:hypothetical protein
MSLFKSTNTVRKRAVTHIRLRLWLPKINPRHILQQLVPTVWVNEHRCEASITVAVCAVESHRKSFIRKTSRFRGTASCRNTEIALEYS